MKRNFAPAFIKHDQATRTRQLPVAFGAALAAVQSPGSSAASCLLHPGPGTFWTAVKTETIYIHIGLVAGFNRPPENV